MNFLFHWEWFFVSSSDDLVQLCVDYLKEYPLLVGSGLACPVLLFDVKWSKFSFHSSPRFSRRKERSLHISPRFSCSWLSCGWWKARRRDRADPKRTKRRNKGRQSKFHPEYLRVLYKTFIGNFHRCFSSGSAKESKSSKGTPKTPKSSQKKEEGKESVKEKKDEKKLKESSKNK